MADFFYGEYKPLRLFLKQCDVNTKYEIDPKETYIDIGLKGSNEDGLVQKRMSAIKDKMNNTLKKNMQNKMKDMSATKMRGESGDKGALSELTLYQPDGSPAIALQ